MTDVNKDQFIDQVHGLANEHLLTELAVGQQVANYTVTAIVPKINVIEPTKPFIQFVNKDDVTKMVRIYISDIDYYPTIELYKDLQKHYTDDDLHVKLTLSNHASYNDVFEDSVDNTIAINNFGIHKLVAALDSILYSEALTVMNAIHKPNDAFNSLCQLLGELNQQSVSQLYGALDDMSADTKSDAIMKIATNKSIQELLKNLLKP